jgi:hypothetical protein
MKSLLVLWKDVADDSATRCSTSANRDFEEVTRRVDTEGLSFMTITLPTFGKGFERALAEEKVSSNDHFHGWKMAGRIPAFLQGFVGQVFDSQTGVMLPQPNIEAIRAVRQLTLMFNKILLPTSQKRKDSAFNAYVETDKELKDWWRHMESSASGRKSLADFHVTATQLFGRIFSDLDIRVRDHELLPKHGPGATADRLRGNAKYRFERWTIRLERDFPFGEYCLPNWRYSQSMDSVEFLAPGSELPVRVISVPKTLKTPRIIAIEPTAMQYCQQAVATSLVELIQRDGVLGRVIGFDDQEPNRRMAEQGSIDGDLATLDLSDASDRVSNQLVRRLTPGPGYSFRAIQACRSQTADVDGHGVIRLAKYASMGSALTFPIEAMVFLTVIMVAIRKHMHTSGHAYTLLSAMAGQVRVFGDDIIVPSEYAAIVAEELELFGLKVNRSKSFWTGMFRESCGVEFFAGEDVSIVRIRRELPESRSDVPEILSCAETRNQLYMAGYWETARRLDQRLERLLDGDYPCVDPTSPVVGRHSLFGYLHTDKLHEYYHSPLVRGFVASSQPPVSELDDVPALLKYFLKRSEEPLQDGHLERQGRPAAVYLKRRWSSPF